MGLINIGNDIGYGYVLGSSALGESKISSFIKKIDESEALRIKENIATSNENNILVKVNNGYYVLGKLCEKRYGKEKRRPLGNRVNDEYYLVQLLTSISLTTSTSNNIDINLMLGIPNKMEHLKKPMQEWLSNKKYTITFLSRDKNTVKTINVRKCYCSIQPLFPILNTIHPDDLKKKIISIDIGHGTIDMIRWEDYDISEEFGEMVSSTGVSKAYQILERKLIDRFRNENKPIFEIPEKELQLAIETGYFALSGGRLDIQKQLEETFSEFANYVFEEVERAYMDILMFTDIILISGGVASNDFFMSQLATKFKGYEIVVLTDNEPQWAIVRGQKKLLDTLEEDDFTNGEKEVAVTHNVKKEADKN